MSEHVATGRFGRLFLGLFAAVGLCAGPFLPWVTGGETYPAGSENDDYYFTLSMFETSVDHALPSLSLFAGAFLVLGVGQLAASVYEARGGGRRAALLMIVIGALGVGALVTAAAVTTLFFFLFAGFSSGNPSLVPGIGAFVLLLGTGVALTVGIRSHRLARHRPAAS